MMKKYISIEINMYFQGLLRHIILSFNKDDLFFRFFVLKICLKNKIRIIKKNKKSFKKIGINLYLMKYRCLWNVNFWFQLIGNLTSKQEQTYKPQ